MSRCRGGAVRSGLARADLTIQIVALLGLAMLLFLAGLEVDVRTLGGGLLPLAAAGFVLSLVIGWGAGLGLPAAGWVRDPLLLAVTVSATSLGLVVAVLKDSGQLTSPLGQTTIAASSLADFAAVLLLSLLFSADGKSTGSQLLLVVLFAGIVALVGLAAATTGRIMRLSGVLLTLQDSTAEIRVRAAMVLLIPVFFVASGMRLDVSGLVQSPEQLLRLSVYVAVLLLARGLPALLYVRRLGRSGSLAAGLLQATSLPFIVAATQIGTLTGRMDPQTATGIVCAGLISVLVFPALAVAIAGRGRSREDADTTRTGFQRPEPRLDRRCTVHFCADGAPAGPADLPRACTPLSRMAV
ncbi:MAG: cation:proton antiporter [Nocardioides sp.]|nr:cation:proton antiporter [Nocardioides sp.]